MNKINDLLNSEEVQSVYGEKNKKEAVNYSTTAQLTTEKYYFACRSKCLHSLEVIFAFFSASCKAYQGLKKGLNFSFSFKAWKKNIFLPGGKISKSFMNRGL